MLLLAKRLQLGVLGASLIFAIVAFSIPSLRNTIHPVGIIIHHAAVPPFPDRRAIDSSVIDEIHRERGFHAFYWGRLYHIGYHYVILPDGTVQSGRPEHCQGAHAEGYNSYIGICLVGDFSSRDNPNGERGLTVPTAAQMRALTDLCRSLSERYHIPVGQILAHKDVNPNTECPGDRFPLAAFRKTLPQHF